MIDAPIVGDEFPGEVGLRRFAERLRERLWEGGWARSRTYRPLTWELRDYLNEIILTTAGPWFPGEELKRREWLLLELTNIVWVLRQLQWHLSDVPMGQLADQLLEEIPHLADEAGARLELAVAQRRAVEAESGRYAYVNVARWARQFVRRLLKPRRRRRRRR